MLHLDPLDAIPRRTLLLLMLCFVADLDVLRLKLDCPVLSNFRILLKMHDATLPMMGKHTWRVFWLSGAYEESRRVRNKSYHSQGRPV
jgi:hypothetical protein